MLLLLIDFWAARPSCPFIRWCLLRLNNLLEEFEPLVNPDEPAFVPQVFRFEANSLDVVIIACRGPQIELVHVFHRFDQVIESID